jgi:hypothetical protein
MERDMTPEEKIENLLFVIWVQDQRHDYWMKVIKDVKRELGVLKEVMEADGWIQDKTTMEL